MPAFFMGRCSAHIIGWRFVNFIFCREISPENIVYRSRMSREQLPPSFKDDDLWLRSGAFGLRLPAAQRVINRSDVGKRENGEEMDMSTLTCAI
jgi:hypothetical protein